LRSSLDFIRRTIIDQGLLMTRHGVQEGTAENVSVLEIQEAILNGEILEDYWDDRRGPCCLIYGRALSGRDLHVVVTSDKVPVRVITVYEPRLPHWRSPRERGG